MVLALLFGSCVSWFSLFDIRLLIMHSLWLHPQWMLRRTVQTYFVQIILNIFLFVWLKGWVRTVLDFVAVLVKWKMTFQFYSVLFIRHFDRWRTIDWQVLVLFFDSWFSNAQQMANNVVVFRTFVFIIIEPIVFDLVYVCIFFICKFN